MGLFDFGKKKVPAPKQEQNNANQTTQQKQPVVSVLEQQEIHKKQKQDPSLYHPSRPAPTVPPQALQKKPLQLDEEYIKRLVGEVNQHREKIEQCDKKIEWARNEEQRLIREEQRLIQDAKDRYAVEIPKEQGALQNLRNEVADLRKWSNNKQSLPNSNAGSYFIK